MDKLLNDYRSTIGDFEVIDFVDEEPIETLRTQLHVDAPMAVKWNEWEYGAEVAELRALYEKGKRNQWNATDDVDWDIPVSKDEWVGNPEVSHLVHVLRKMGADEKTQKAAMFDEMAYMVSQLLHGEQAALQISGQLTNVCPTTDEKFYAAQQVADEARHTEVMARFLAEKMGTIYPIDPGIKVLLDELLKARNYYQKTLGMQTLFEGIAMAILDLLTTQMTNPLFVDVMRRVKVDEARHAAFGVLTMRRAVKEVSTEEKNELEDWAFNILEVLNANQQLSMIREVGRNYGVDGRRWVKKLLGMDSWVAMNSTMYMHTVMPNLMRLGLVTERTESRYRELGILSDIRLQS